MRGSAYDSVPLNMQLQQTHKKIMGLKWLGERGEERSSDAKLRYIQEHLAEAEFKSEQG